MRLFKKLYSFVIFFQFCLFVIFVLENITNLNKITFNLAVLGQTYNFTINFYVVIGIIAVFYALVLLMSVNVFGFGLNEEGSRNMGRLISLIAIISVLTLTNSYYVLQFGNVGLIFEVLLLMIYLFYAIDSTNVDYGGSDE